MSDEKKVSKTVQFQAVVDSLPEAWAFIMDAIEQVGPDPSVHIHPSRNTLPPGLQALLTGGASETPERKFQVVVEGTVDVVREEVKTL